MPFIALWAAIAGVWLADRLSVVPVPASGRRAAMAVALLLLVVPGALGSIAFVRAHGTETTQALAWAWMKKSIWPGSSILSEARGFELPSERYRAEVVSSVAEREPEAIVGAGVEWIVLSSDAWGGRPPRGGETASAAVPEAYAPIMARTRPATVIMPSADHPGPVIHILRVEDR